MAIFLQIIFGFPTVLFTALLALVLLYWLVAITGVLELEALDHLMLGQDGWGDAGGLAALLNKVGLGRVPLTIIISLIVLFGWVVCFAGVRLLMPATEVVAIRFVVGAAIFAAALVAGVLATIVALRPVHALLRRIPAEDVAVSLLGRTGVVRSGKVTPHSGQALVEDGGAGLLLQVRTIDDTLPRGTRVVVIEQLPERNAWRVVSEEEFRGG
ncbi:hypothetical protein AAV94_03950 [Lampropedia cohaerens]|uniref:Ubiquinone biosynthesis protein UbiH n=1 Tax=Lampropedia cohaerens TaxID=1610491 RepID=A0A0U1Q1N2_9BURK|nr:NfeD family protein [Lampropedia cohaerens]KKW68684.1 hypothetical protein AAV94_03950 [Lampropedia cohaerens]